jgi:hypothetical protein
MHLPPAGLLVLASALGLAMALPMEDAAAPSMGIEMPIKLDETEMIENKMHIHHIEYMHDETPKRAMQTGPAFNIEMMSSQMDDKQMMNEQMHMYHEHDYYAQKEKRHDDAPCETPSDDPTLTKPPTPTSTSETTTEIETETRTTTAKSDGDDDEPTKPSGHYDEYGKYGDYGKYGNYKDYDDAIGREMDIPHQSW